MLLRILPLGELVFDELLISHPGAHTWLAIGPYDKYTHTQASYFFTDNIAKFGSGKGAGKILVPPTATCDLAAVYYMHEYISTQDPTNNKTPHYLSYAL